MVLPVCHSLASNNLHGGDNDMSSVIKLAEVLPSTSITLLKCAPQHLYTTLR